MRVQTDPMAHLCAAAHVKVARHYNTLAADALHDDLLALATGVVCGVTERHATKSAILSQINEAKTPEELDKIIFNLIGR